MAVDRVLEVALGFYVSPLVSVLLGVTVLRERLQSAQWAALVLAATAVVVIAAGSGQVPFLALALAATFGMYGLLKKTVPLSAPAGLTAEGAVLGLPALALLVGLELAGHGSVTDHGPVHALLLVAAGPVTAVPLLLFAAAARRVPLSTVGVLQYLTPTLQFAWGVAVVHEPMPAARWTGFALVWLALVVITVDMVRQARTGRLGGPAADIPLAAAEAH